MLFLVCTTRSRNYMQLLWFLIGKVTYSVCDVLLELGGPCSILSTDV